MLKQLSPELQLKPIHLTLVSLVIVTAQMEDAVYDKLAHLALQTMARLFGLASGSIRRDQYVAQIIGLKIVLGRKREHVGRLALTPESEIQFSNPSVAHERDGQRRVSAAN